METRDLLVECLPQCALHLVSALKVTQTAAHPFPAHVAHFVALVAHVIATSPMQMCVDKAATPWLVPSVPMSYLASSGYSKARA